jgi:predicted membrane protein
MSPRSSGLLTKSSIIYIYNQQAALVVPLNPRFIALVKAAKVLYAYGVFIITSAFMYLFYQVWYTAAQVYKQVRRTYKTFHKFKKRFIVAKISVAHKPHGMEVRRKNMRVFIYGAVLDNVFAAFTKL